MKLLFEMFSLIIDAYRFRCLKGKFCLLALLRIIAGAVSLVCVPAGP